RSFLLLFFFSSRRRHTRFKCDWSSDVCSSDLRFGEPELLAAGDMKVVTRIGVGFDAVDVPALSKHKVPLMVAGTANSPSVAEQRSEERRVGKEWTSPGGTATWERDRE